MGYIPAWWLFWWCLPASVGYPACCNRLSSCLHAPRCRRPPSLLPSCRRAGRPAHALARGGAAGGDQQRRHDRGLVPLPARLPALHLNQDLQHRWASWAGQGRATPVGELGWVGHPACIRTPGSAPTACPTACLNSLLPRAPASCPLPHLPTHHNHPLPPSLPTSAPLAACSAQRQPRGVRHHLQAAQHHRMGVSQAWPSGARWRPGGGPGCRRARVRRAHALGARTKHIALRPSHSAVPRLLLFSCIPMQHTRSVSTGEGTNKWRHIWR